jgi:hypothetical protein
MKFQAPEDVHLNRVPSAIITRSYKRLERRFLDLARKIPITKRRRLKDCTFHFYY